ncbi:hypothetical protein C8J56DRAFT_323054 [Mycena floridula]|nr:hypothetical protein C8J56DRAFT_323054 [Mycena floridula]
MQNSSQVPYGHNDQTIVDTVVRDAWEISADKITFLNPLWATFLSGQVVPTVGQALGIPVAHTRCELYKLLLYQEGSHFNRHQDTGKSPGMFATVIIILPSLYSGGQVHVSHSTASETFDFSPQFQVSTAVLA